MPTFHDHPDHSIKVHQRDGLPVQLDGRGYIIDTTGFERLTIQAQRQLVDDGAEVGDRTLNGQGTWKRSQIRFDHGAGQANWDETETTDRAQFNWSYGIDPWTPREIKLHHDVDVVHDQGVTVMDAAGNYLYFATAAALFWSDDPALGTWNTQAIPNVTHISYDGETVYVSDGTQVWSGAPGDATLTANTLTGDFVANTPVAVWFSSGKLIVNMGSEVGEMDTSFVYAQIDVAPPGTKITNGFRLGGETYVTTRSKDDNTNTSSDHSLILWATRVSDIAGTQFNALVPVVELPLGEQIWSAVGVGDRAFVGTSVGFRLITPIAEGRLEYGLAVATSPPTDYMTGPQLVDMAVEGQFGWGTVTRPDNAATFIGAVRTNLSTFTNEGVPAYALDVGIYDETGGAIASTAVARFNGRTYIGTTVALHAETDEYVPRGVIDVGWINFTTPELKAFTSLNVRTHPLPEDTAIRAWGVGDKDIEIGIMLMLGDGLTRATETAGGPGSTLVNEEGALRFELARQDNVPTETPRLRRWTLKALPLPFRAEEIVLPVIVSDAVEDIPGVTAVMDTHDDIEYLLELLQSRQIVPLKLGDETLMVYVDGVEIDNAKASAGVRDWNLNRTTFLATWNVTVITTDASPPTEPNRLLGEPDD